MFNAANNRHNLCTHPCQFLFFLKRLRMVAYVLCRSQANRFVFRGKQVCLLFKESARAIGRWVKGTTLYYLLHQFKIKTNSWDLHSYWQQAIFSPSQVMKQWYAPYVSLYSYSLYKYWIWKKSKTKNRMMNQLMKYSSCLKFGNHHCCPLTFNQAVKLEYSPLCAKCHPLICIVSLAIFHSQFLW